MAIAPSPAAPTTAVTPLDDRVPFPTKVVYGAAGLTTILHGHLPKNLANPIFVVTLGVSPTLVSLAMMIFRMFDAFVDPLIGWASDNTRTRWGRRRPYILVGGVLAGLVMPVMWLVSPQWSSTYTVAWFIGSGVLLYLCSSLFAMPYESLNLELTPDYNERTSVASYKAFFQKIGALIVGWAWFITQLPLFNDPLTGKNDIIAGARGLSVAAGVICIVLSVLAALFIKERFYKKAAHQRKVSLKDNFRYTFGNKAFLLLAAMTVCFASAYYLSQSMTFFLRLYYVTGGNAALAAKIGGVEATLTMVLGIASIPCFSWLARRIGKTWTLMAAMGLTLFALASKWWTYTPDHPWLSMVSPILLAPSLTGIWQIVPSMNGDVCDDDELRTGERREGAFASIYSWVVNMSFTSGLALAGPLVELCGFQVSLGAHQAPETILAMRMVDSALPTLLLGIGMLLLHRYPLSPARMKTIRQQLELRRGFL